MPLSGEELPVGTQVIDNFRTELYGQTIGVVEGSMGPHRTRVQWPDDRGSQIEKTADLVRAERKHT